MQSTKLFILINELHSTELKQLNKFVQSPYFNSRQDVCQIVEILVKNIRSNPASLSKKNVWKVVHPNEEYDDQKMRLLLSYTYKVVEKFLAYEILAKDEFLVKKSLVKAYRERQFHKSYPNAYRNACQFLEKRSFRNLDYLLMQHELKNEFYEYQSKINRTKDISLDIISHSLDQYFIASKLKFLCFASSYQFLFGKSFDIQLGELLIDYINKHQELLEVPAISIYFNAYMATNNEEEHEYYFDQLRAEISIHANSFSEGEIRDIFIIALNYCTRQMNLGFENYTSEAFKLYKTGIEQGYLIENNQISQFTFNNISTLGIILNEFEWVEQFIENHHQLLPRKNRRNTYNLIRASISYHQKNYDEALTLLNTFNTNDTILELRMRNLRLKIYFEIEAFELLDSHIKSMLAYLNRKEVANRQKKPFQLFLNLTSKLVRMKTGDPFNKEGFYQDLNRLNVTPLKNWLLSQLEPKIDAQIE